MRLLTNIGWVEEIAEDKWLSVILNRYRGYQGIWRDKGRSELQILNQEAKFLPFLAPQAKILRILEVLKLDFFPFLRRRQKFWEFCKDRSLIPSRFCPQIGYISCGFCVNFGQIYAKRNARPKINAKRKKRKTQCAHPWLWCEYVFLHFRG